MSPVEFELTISAGERPQIYALNRAAAGTGSRGLKYLNLKYVLLVLNIQGVFTTNIQGVFYII